LNPERKLHISYRQLLSKTIEEFYYLIMGIQYPAPPINITEDQWNISDIDTPVPYQLLFEVLEEPFIGMRDPW